MNKNSNITLYYKYYNVKKISIIENNYDNSRDKH